MPIGQEGPRDQERVQHDYPQGLMPRSVEESALHAFPSGAVNGNEAHPGLESRGRSLAKALSWRVAAFVITAGIVWGATGEVHFAAAVGVADALLKVGTYYLHERAWNGFSFGRRGR